jgi:hypothetical protein
MVLLAIQSCSLEKSQDYSEMAKTRRAKRGGGYGTSQQFFNPSVLPPAASIFSSDVSTAATSSMIRPVLPATFKGGRRRTRRALKGGFSPSIMGGFIPNAQAAIVPAALYLVYHTMVPKSSKGSAKRASARRRRR